MLSGWAIVFSMHTGANPELGSSAQELMANIENLPPLPMPQKSSLPRQESTKISTLARSDDISNLDQGEMQVAQRANLEKLDSELENDPNLRTAADQVIDNQQAQVNAPAVQAGAQEATSAAGQAAPGMMPPAPAVQPAPEAAPSPSPAQAAPVQEHLYLSTPGQESAGSTAVPSNPVPATASGQAEAGIKNQDKTDAAANRNLSLPTLPKIANVTPDEVLLKALMEQEGASETQPATNAQEPQNIYAPNNIDDPAFIKMLQQKFPLSPEQIRALRMLVDKQYRAIRSQIKVPTPSLASRWVSLEPGSVPPVIRLATGYVSSLVFVDQTGAPWPIKSYDIGNPKSFNVQWDKNNILMIQGMLQYQTGNMVVQLVGLPTPIIITIVSDQDQVDYRLDLRIASRGPNAAPEIIGDTIAGAPNDILSNLLQGVAPEGAEALKVCGGNAQAWVDRQNNLLLRTKLTVLSPSWSQYMRSIDGTQVYMLSKVPVILASDNGKTVQLTIEGF